VEGRELHCIAKSCVRINKFSGTTTTTTRKKGENTSWMIRNGAQSAGAGQWERLIRCRMRTRSLITAETTFTFRPLPRVRSP